MHGVVPPCPRGGPVTHASADSVGTAGHHLRSHCRAKAAFAHPTLSERLVRPEPGSREGDFGPQWQIGGAGAGLDRVASGRNGPVAGG